MKIIDSWVKNEQFPISYVYDHIIRKNQKDRLYLKMSTNCIYVNKVQKKKKEEKTKQKKTKKKKTGSRLITEVKSGWAKLVLGWVTAWEYFVL